MPINEQESVLLRRILRADKAHRIKKMSFTADSVVFGEPLNQTVGKAKAEKMTDKEWEEWLKALS